MFIVMQPYNTPDRPPHGMERVFVAHRVYFKAASAHQFRKFPRVITPDMAARGSVIFIREKIVDGLAEPGGDGNGDAAVFFQNPGKLPARKGVIPDMLHDLRADYPVKGIVPEGKPQSITRMHAKIAVVRANPCLVNFYQGESRLSGAFHVHVHTEHFCLTRDKFNRMPPEAAARVKDNIP